MLKIALIDDKSYGLKQINERHNGEKFSLEYFSTFQEFQKSGETFDIVYLDYYLEKDGITADQILAEVKAQAGKVIAFSSVERRSEELVKLGADEWILKK